MISTRPYPVLLILCIVFSACCPHPLPDDLTLVIEAPTAHSVVEHRMLVEGRVSDPAVEIWVLVHPLAGGRWWVQRRPAPANRDGRWKSYAFFGTEDLGRGETFELIAIATFKRLEEGREIDLDDLPRETVRSETVTVTRR